MKASFLRVLILTSVVGAFSHALLAQNGVEPTVTIYATDARASEAGSDMGTFTVRRNGPTNFPLYVFYYFSGTASNGVDYEHLGMSVPIPAGAFEASFMVKPIDDSLVEGDERVVAQLTGSPLDCATCGYAIGVPSNAVVVIADNDTPPQTPYVRLNVPQNGDVFITPANIALQAYAQDAEDHYHLTVEFFEGTNSLGLGTFIPSLCPDPYCPYYALVWSNAPPGQYFLRAKATDSGGATSVSDPVYVAVFGGVNIYATDPDAAEIHSAPNIDPPSNPAVFTVRRFGETNEGIVVYYEVSGTASNGVDYPRLPGQVSLPAGVSSAQIIVYPIDDNLAEGMETVVLTLLPPCDQCLFANPMCDVPQGTNCYPIGPDRQAVAYIRDNDQTDGQPVVNIYASDATGREIPVVPPWLGTAQESDPIVFTVTRTGPTNSPLTVFYSVGGTASNGVDYFYGGDGGFDGLLPGRVTIPAGASSADIPALVIDDLFVEGTETVELTVQPPVCIQIFPPPPECYLVGSNSHAVANILDNDRTPPSVVTIVATDPAASESGPDNGTFTVHRTGDTSNPLLVLYTIGGTAQSGVDYLTFTNIDGFIQTFSGFPNVIIPAGESSADITVTPVDDGLAEGSETVRLRLQQPPWAGYIAGTPSNAVVTIADNDLVGTNHPPFVQLNAPQDGDTFRAPADIQLVAFALDAEDHYSLTVEFFQGTNSLGFGTFNPSRCSVCPNYILTWSNAPPGRYELTAKTTDSGGASSASEPVHITVIETAPPGVSIYATDSVATEQPAVSAIPPDTATFTVRRPWTNGSIVVYYQVSGTASNGVDYQMLSGQVTIPAGASSAEIEVVPIDDNFVEGTETVVLTLLPPPCCPPCRFTSPPCLFVNLPCETNCYPIGPDTQAVAYIRDNDQTNLPPVVNVVARDPFASEGTNFWFRDWDANHAAFDFWNAWRVNLGGTNTATFVVRRHGPTDGALTVNYEIGGTASNGVDYVSLPGSVAIPSGKRSAQIVVVPIDDALAEGIETVVVTLRPSLNYSVGFPSHAAAILIDNDHPRPPCVLLPDHRFHLCGPATNGFCFRIEASTNLLHWSPLCTNVVTDGALHFVDPDSPPLNARFYRAAPEPGLPPDD